MNRLTAILDWIDNAAGALICLAYLAAGVTAVAVYFGARHLSPSVDAALNAGLPWALAFAVETGPGHSEIADAGRMVYRAHDVRERHPMVTSDAL